MERLRLQELLDACGGRLIGGADPEKAFFTGVCTDNRKVQPGDLFVAIVGERLDGHRFAKAALEAGAAGCLISDAGCAEALAEAYESAFFVLVSDTVKAMGALAACYRSKFSIPVIGVTGSVGKTTTKQMLASVLSQKYRVLYTEGNFNNHIGLPMTIFRLDRTHEAAVLEMGMNHMGEIDYLTRIARPDIAVITNVGDAHIQNLGSRENIFKAKCEIFHGLRDGGTAILNGDDALLRTLRDARNNFRVLLVGEAEDCDLRAEEIAAEGAGLRFAMRGSLNGDAESKGEAQEPCLMEVPAPGRHMIYPALTAAAAGMLLGMTGEEIAAGVSAFVQTGMRMKVTRAASGIQIYNDAYNANPQSMRAALQILEQAPGITRRIAVLGDMLELGAFSDTLHREIGAAAAETGLDALVTVGPAARLIAEEAEKCGLRNVYACADKQQAQKRLAELLAPGAGKDAETAVLFKASRGMALEELAAFIE